jgi:predicted 3-demethylubiquinone-9 3-methyltransferase (glyoxalase superfamily)
MNFAALQTIGYDSARKQFTSTWVDSLASYTWNSTGSLDSGGKTLTLNTEGPDWSDPNKKKQYRDLYEFKSATEIATLSQMMNDDGDWETFSRGSMTKLIEPKLRTTVTPFLMFEGQAESAIDFYKTVFPDTQIESMTKYEAGETGKEGTVKLATVVIAGQSIKCIDSHIKHDFGFTPAFSFFVECESKAQLKQRFEKLAKGGKVMMPIDNYGFSQQFGWVSDQFGVSWQLNLK